MKIAVLTASIGEIDKPKPLVEQSVSFDYFNFNLNNLPFPLPNLNNRLKGKYLKTLSHRILPNYDIYIWIDGNVEVTSSKFVERMSDLLKKSEVAIATHPDRNNVYDELNFILDAIKHKVPYLTVRYENEPLAEELLFFEKNNFPKNYPLYACRVFARKNTNKVNNAFNDWWLRCLEFTNFDQTMFSYIAKTNKLKLSTFPYTELETYITKHTHHKII